MTEFIIWLVGFALTAVVARSNGRNVWIALFWGFLFSWGALIVYAIMGKTFDKKYQEAKAISDAMETQPIVVPVVKTEETVVVAEATPEAPVKKPRKPRAKKAATA